jgi:hypothetical protein
MASFRKINDRDLIGTRRLLLVDWHVLDGERIESLSGAGPRWDRVDARNVLPVGAGVVVDAAEFGLPHPAYWITTAKGRFRAWKADLLRYSEPWTEKARERALRGAERQRR